MCDLLEYFQKCDRTQCGNISLNHGRLTWTHSHITQTCHRSKLTTIPSGGSFWVYHPLPKGTFSNPSNLSGIYISRGNAARNREVVCSKATCNTWWSHAASPPSMHRCVLSPVKLRMHSHSSPCGYIFLRNSETRLSSVYVCACFLKVHSISKFSRHAWITILNTGHASRPTNSAMLASWQLRVWTTLWIWMFVFMFNRVRSRCMMSSVVFIEILMKWLILSEILSIKCFFFCRTLCLCLSCSLYLRNPNKIRGKAPFFSKACTSTSEFHPLQSPPITATSRPKSRLIELSQAHWITCSNDTATILHSNWPESESLHHVLQGVCPPCSALAVEGIECPWISPQSEMFFSEVCSAVICLCCQKCARAWQSVLAHSCTVTKDLELDRAGACLQVLIFVHTPSTCQEVSREKLEDQSWAFSQGFCGAAE